MNLVAIETSTEFCSLAVARGEATFARHFPAGQRHAELALNALDQLLREAGLAFEDIQGIAYGEGPGSFTGLRVACGIAQGLAFARSLPVIGIGTLVALAEQSGAENVIACLDARMGEVYHAAYRSAGNAWTEVCAPGLYRPDAAPAVLAADWIGCGSGFAAHAEALSARYRGQLQDIRPNVLPMAEAVLRLARPRFERGEGRDAASAVPIYLRDKVALKTDERR